MKKVAVFFFSFFIALGIFGQNAAVSSWQQIFYEECGWRCDRIERKEQVEAFFTSLQTPVPEASAPFKILCENNSAGCRIACREDFLYNLNSIVFAPLE